MTSKKIPKNNEAPAPKSSKQTLYIDVEDEITGVIDKVATSKNSIIAIVLPKHASVFQSIVNMKLLKKAATQAKKNIVLVTSDLSVMPIAATVGLYVAKTPSSKPEIPVIATISHVNEGASELDDSQEELSVVHTSEAPIELDNTTSTAVDIDDKSIKDESVKHKKTKSFKIPNFSSFRMKLFIGGSVLIGLIVLWVFGFVILPKATITINTDTQSAPVNTLVTLQTGIDEASLDSATLPAKRAQIEKTEEATVPATGQKNIGQKATGSMNIENCINIDGSKIVPAGTRFSAGSVTFESVEQATLPEARFNGSGQCTTKEDGRDLTVGVIALEPGDSSNVGSQSYNAAISGINAVGSVMTGGTTENVTVISQEDVDRARQQSAGSSKSAALEELKIQLSEQDVDAVEESLTESDPRVDISPAVGAEAAEVTVKTTISFAMLGVAENDVSAFLDKEIQDSLEDQEKNIRDNGLSEVSYRLSERPDESRQIFTLVTVGSVGPEFNITELKDSVAGIKRGDIEKQIEAIDGVRSVSVEYSPAWITTTPKSADKIDILLNEQDDR